MLKTVYFCLTLFEIARLSRFQRLYRVKAFCKQQRQSLTSTLWIILILLFHLNSHFRSFRFKIKYEAFGHVWLDLTDDTRKVPICDGKITLKVLPMGELTAVPVLKKHGTFC